MKILRCCFAVVALLVFCLGTQAQQNEALKPGDPSPDFKYEDMSGKVRSLSEFRGKYVLIDFWASWCAPCREQIPYWKKIVRKIKKKNMNKINGKSHYIRTSLLQ